VIEPRIVRRYATALFNAARKAGVVDQVESDLGLVSFTVESSPRLRQALESPLVPAERKHGVLDGVFRGKVHEVTLSYLYLLVDKRREEAITATEPVYIELANEARGIVSVNVTTAAPLSKEQEARLKAKLSERTGKTVELAVRVDPSIIGGVSIKIGDTVIDGSIKGQLGTLREKLLS